jgi:hypothetical protein
MLCKVALVFCVILYRYKYYKASLYTAETPFLVSKIHLEARWKEIEKEQLDLRV